MRPSLTVTRNSAGWCACHIWRRSHAAFVQDGAASAWRGAAQRAIATIGRVCMLPEDLAFFLDTVDTEKLVGAVVRMLAAGGDASQRNARCVAKLSSLVRGNAFAVSWPLVQRALASGGDALQQNARCAPILSSWVRCCSLVSRPTGVGIMRASFAARYNVCP